MPASFHRFAVVVLALAVFGSVSASQEGGVPTPKTKKADTPAPEPQPEPDDGFTTLDSTVGYIDPAIPMNQFRFRYDSAYNFVRSNRAEYFYKRFALPLTDPYPNTKLDYQELSAYGEVLITDRWSLLAEVPIRFTNSEVFQNYYGLSDITVGGKYAFIREQNLVTSLQLRVTSPSGDWDRLLGNGHVSIEPGLLGWYRPSPDWALEGEVRYWAPVGGTDYAGAIMRYGLGVSRSFCVQENLRVSPVAEFVGWTVLGGKERYQLPNGFSMTEEAVGDTIVNAKIGVRVFMGVNNDMYLGYGHALTGDKWYEDVFRFEWRYKF